MNAWMKRGTIKENWSPIIWRHKYSSCVLGFCLSYGTYPILCCNIYLCNCLLSPPDYKLPTYMALQPLIPTTVSLYRRHSAHICWTNWLLNHPSTSSSSQDPVLSWRIISGNFFKVNFKKDFFDWSIVDLQYYISVRYKA